MYLILFFRPYCRRLFSVLHTSHFWQSKVGGQVAFPMEVHLSVLSKGALFHMTCCQAISFLGKIFLLVIIINLVLSVSLDIILLGLKNT